MKAVRAFRRTFIVMGWNLSQEMDRKANDNSGRRKLTENQRECVCKNP